MGKTILTALKDNAPEMLADYQDWKAVLDPEAYVTPKVSGIPSFKTFFLSEEYKKYLAAQKTTMHLQRVRNYLHRRGVPTETLEIIYDERKGTMTDETIHSELLERMYVTFRSRSTDLNIDS